MNSVGLRLSEFDLMVHEVVSSAVGSTTEAVVRKAAQDIYDADPAGKASPSTNPVSAVVSSLIDT